MEYRGRRTDMRRSETCNVMVIHRPPAIRDDVIKHATGGNVVLRQYVIANVSSALPLRRQKLHPIQGPVRNGLPIRTAIFHMIPHAEGDPQQLVA